MLKQAAYTAACWLAFNKTGNKVAVASYRVASKMGDMALRAMPQKYSRPFGATQNVLNELLAEPKEEASHDDTARKD